METLGLKCNKCGCTSNLLTLKGDAIAAFATETKHDVETIARTGLFVMIHRNGCYQTEVEARSPRKLTEMFSLTEKEETKENA
jgi:hypothetical protein